MDGEGSSKIATVTCYGHSCTAIQNGHPIRLCTDCHMAQHSDLSDPDLHIYQSEWAGIVGVASY